MVNPAEKNKQNVLSSCSTAKIRLFTTSVDPCLLLHTPPALEKLRLHPWLNHFLLTSFTFKSHLSPPLLSPLDCSDPTSFDPTTLSRSSVSAQFRSSLILPDLSYPSNHEARVDGSSPLVGCFGRQCQCMSSLGLCLLNCCWADLTALL